MDRTKYLSADEMRALRDSAREHAESDPLTWLCVDLALQTGLRVSEMAALVPKDVDLRRGCMTVWRKKRRKPVREIIALSSSLHAHLSRHLRDCGDVFWPGQRGPWTKRGLQQAWDKACRRAGIEGVSIHKARHTLAVHLLKETKNLRAVQKQLGHTSPVITANMYADIPFEDQVEALDGVFDDE